MINLLPEREKKSVEREYYRRIIVVAGIFIFSLICIAIILLLPSYFLLISQENIFNSQFDILKRGLREENSGAIELVVKNLNSDLIFLDNQEKNINQVNLLIKKILTIRTRSIKINSIVGQKNQQGEITLSLTGKSLTRNSLISFIDDIKKMKDIRDINSPPSNLLKGENLSFSLVVEFNLPKEVEN